MLPIPGYYGKLKEFRKQENIQLKSCKHVKPETKLRGYQAVGVLNLILAPRFVLGDAPGLGKTLESLVSFAFLKEKNPELKLLVVAPKSSLFQWKAETEKFLTGITAFVVASGRYKIPGQKALTGKQSRHYQINKFFNDNFDILIINYNTLEKEHENIVPRLGKFMAIFDEATYFKNHKTVTHRAVKSTSLLAQRVISMTATMLKNRMEEAFSIYDATVPGLFRNITRFRKAFHKTIFIPVNGRKIPKIIGYKNLEIFRDYIDPYFLGRKKEDVAKELPYLISKEVILEMEDDQQEAYLNALDGILSLIVELEGVVEEGRGVKAITGITGVQSVKFLDNQIKKIHKFSTLMYCQQISNSPATVGVQATSSKEEELIKLLKNDLEDEKTIIFTNFKKQIDRFEEIFKKEKLQMTRITGDETSAQREVNKTQFQDTNSGINVIFINRAGSEAINLQAASTFIFFDLPWSYGDYQQLVGRAQRIGSEHSSILVLHFINKGTIDEHVLKVLQKKKELVSNVFGETTFGELMFENDAVETLFQHLIKDAKEHG